MTSTKTCRKRTRVIVAVGRLIKYSISVRMCLLRKRKRRKTSLSRAFTMKTRIMKAKTGSMLLPRGGSIPMWERPSLKLSLAVRTQLSILKGKGNITKLARFP